MIDFTLLSTTPSALQTLLGPYIHSENRTWYRAIQLKFMSTALQYTHTQKQTSRFGAGTPTTPAHSLLYFAENHHVALLEVLAIFSPPGSTITLPNPSLVWSILTITVSLSQVADLTSVPAQQALQTTAQELTGDWIGYQLRSLPYASIKIPPMIAPTQELGAALYGVPDLQGFLIPSAKVPDRQNLVLFPDKIKASTSDYVQFVESLSDGSTKTHRIP